MQKMENQTEKINTTMPHVEQWRVTSEGYLKTFSNIEPAKRQFGKICAQIEADEEGFVTLEYRPAATTKKAEEWLAVEEFELGMDDNEEDD